MDGSDYQESSNEPFLHLSEGTDHTDDFHLMKDEFMDLVNAGIHSIIGLPRTPLPFHLGYLTPAMKEEAKEDLNETCDTRKNGLKGLKSLVAGEKNLFCPDRDSFYIQFLRARKFNVQKSFKMLKNYYVFKQKHSKVYQDFDVEGGKTLVAMNCLSMLPYRDYYGSVIVVAKISNWDVDISPFEQMFRVATAGLCLSIEDPATQVAGYRMVLDLRGITLKHLQLSNPRNIMLVIHSTQHCFPGRYKGIHVLSNNKLFGIGYNMCLPFLTSKLKDRIFLHEDNLEGLRDFIDPSVLPKEFGGTGPPIDGSPMIKMALENLDFMHDMLQYGYKTQN